MRIQVNYERLVFIIIRDKKKELIVNCRVLLKIVERYFSFKNPTKKKYQSTYKEKKKILHNGVKWPTVPISSIQFLLKL